MCLPPNRVTLAQKFINNVRANKARGTSDLMIGTVRSQPFEAKSSSETYENKRHDDKDGEDVIEGTGWLLLPYLYPHRYLILILARVE
jgi:hypothetical protein